MRAPLASSNADVVPTILRLFGMPPPTAGTSSHALDELLRGVSPRVRTALVRGDSLVATRRIKEDTAVIYRSVLSRTRVGTTWYFDSTKTTRNSVIDGRQTRRK